VIDRAKLDRAVAANPRWRLLQAEYRLFMIPAAVIMFLGIAVGGHLYGRYLAALDLTGRENTIEQLRAESQKQKRDIDAKSAQLSALQADLQNTRHALDSIKPSANTYIINPNQTLIVADGHLTVGLVGTPGNDSILLNVNGKPQSISAGQAINIAPDQATQCQLSVQSFDVFKAVLVATCSGTKAK
jgi:hypothetical protein